MKADHHNWHQTYRPESRYFHKHNVTLCLVYYKLFFIVHSLSNRLMPNVIRVKRFYPFLPREKNRMETVTSLKFPSSFIVFSRFNFSKPGSEPPKKSKNLKICEKLDLLSRIMFPRKSLLHSLKGSSVLFFIQLSLLGRLHEKCVGTCSNVTNYESTVCAQLIRVNKTIYFTLSIIHVFFYPFAWSILSSIYNVQWLEYRNGMSFHKAKVIINPIQQNERYKHGNCGQNVPNIVVIEKVHDDTVLIQFTRHGWCLL